VIPIFHTKLQFDPVISTTGKLQNHLARFVIQMSHNTNYNILLNADFEYKQQQQKRKIENIKQLIHILISN